MSMRAVAIMRTSSRGSMGGAEASGVPGAATSALTGTLSGCGSRAARVRSLSPGRAHAEARGAGRARSLGGVKHVGDRERGLALDAGVVARALRAVGAVLGAAAGLHAEQRAELDLVGAVVLAVDRLRAVEQL